jgi:excinuclease UvrABC nuclease subunit
VATSFHFDQAAEFTPDRADEVLRSVPAQPGVFALRGPRAEDSPYLTQTTDLRRRMRRLLDPPESQSKRLNLREKVARIEYCVTGSTFESSLVLYDATAALFGHAEARRRLKLHTPYFLRMTIENAFPRVYATNKLSRRGIAQMYGPFPSRVAAERYCDAVLDLFKLRRCSEDLAPYPEHPGCIYGEMGMCLRPCQQVVGPAEYGHEVARVVDFLRTDGRSLLEAIGHSRDRLSEEMMFEEAARQHKRYERVEDVLKLRDELARDADRLNGVAITRSLAPAAVEMWFLRDGNWQEPQRFGFEVQEGKTISLDRKLRETFAAVAPRKLTVRERQEYLALLARWYYSTWRDGEWIGFDSYDDIPYRKLVHAVSRVAK